MLNLLYCTVKYFNSVFNIIVLFCCHIDLYNHSPTSKHLIKIIIIIKIAIRFFSPKWCSPNMKTNAPNVTMQAQFYYCVLECQSVLCNNASTHCITIADISVSK